MYNINPYKHGVFTMKTNISLSMILITIFLINGCASVMGDIRIYEEISEQDESQQEETNQVERKLIDCSVKPAIMDLSFAGILFGIGIYSATIEASPSYGPALFSSDEMVKGMGILMGIVGVIPFFSGLAGLSKYSTCKDDLSAACKTANTTITPLIFPPPASSKNSSPGIGMGLTYRF